jgi:PAS domain S-box-containing protein
MTVVVLAAGEPRVDVGAADAIVEPEWSGHLAHRADCVLIDMDGQRAVAEAQRVAAGDPAVQIIIVAPASEHGRIGRALLFASGAGEVWLREPEALDGAIAEAAGVTRQRRAFRTTQQRVEHDLAAMEPHAARRAVISDAYLAALLALLPDPVISVNEEDEVISWNRAAHRVFGVTRPAALGRRLDELLRPHEPAALASALDAGRDRKAHRAELLFTRPDGDTMAAELVVVRVDAEQHTVRLLHVHDVTERRRQQQALEASTVELEQQAEELQHQSSVLEEAQDELRQVNDNLRRLNAELVTQTQAAERARADAETANRAKSDFLATMSHEIRTPINAIIGYTDLLKLGIGGPLTTQQDEHLERITASSRHLLRLIEDVLDLAKVEAGRVSVAQDSHVLVNAVAAALELVAPQAEAAGITLSTRAADGEDVTYVGDDHRVQQILVNLLGNAVKFSDGGGSVDVTFGLGPRDDAPAAPGQTQWTWASVQDSGRGIAPEDHERIFRPFEQAEGGRTRTRGGAGLGLAISRELARLMGGELTVRSEPDKGAEFTLWLPQAPVARQEATSSVAPSTGLRALGLSLLGALDGIAESTVRRLRVEVGEAAAFSESRLRDHVPSWVAEVAQVLMDLGGAGDMLQLRDGVEIRRVLAELHGLQRAALGGSEENIRAEMVILQSEMDAVLERSGADAETVDLARTVISRLIDEATVTVLRAMRRGG